MRVRAENDVRARVNGRVRKGFLICSHLVAALRAPVRGEDQNVRAGFLEFLDSGGDVAFAQAGPPRTVDADLQSMLGRDHLGFSGGCHLDQDEFTLANLECTFSDEKLKSSSLFYFRGPSSYADILVQGSV